jgi:hypothetical protein
MNGFLGEPSSSELNRRGGVTSSLDHPSLIIHNFNELKGTKMNDLPLNEPVRSGETQVDVEHLNVANDIKMDNIIRADLQKDDHSIDEPLCSSDSSGLSDMLSSDEGGSGDGDGDGELYEERSAYESTDSSFDTEEDEVWVAKKRISSILNGRDNICRNPRGGGEWLMLIR